MRLDVDLCAADVATDVAQLQERLRARSFVLQPVLAPGTARSGLQFGYREADGEFFVYVHDELDDRLAGYTVFNRLVGIDRRADRLLRSPHSRYAPAYQRLGLATAVYQWALNAGMCLITGPRQSVGAHRLWTRLAASYPLAHVSLGDRKLEYLGRCHDPAVLEDFHTRMVLLGAGWNWPRFVLASGCAMADGGASASVPQPHGSAPARQNGRPGQSLAA
jgi:GNAT superfamily N-acetyltransferase